MVKKKTNPLNKRFLRELKSEAGKYIVLFVFIAGVIALVSGFLVASGSMSQAYDESLKNIILKMEILRLKERHQEVC